MIKSIRPVFTGILLRTLFLWIVARIAFTAVNRASASMLGEVTEPGLHGLLDITPPAALVLASVVALLVLSDIRALRERTFLANLGVSLPAVATVSFVLAASFEALLGAVLGVTA